jgi:rhamnulose-1-phosphate aldolase
VQPASETILQKKTVMTGNVDNLSGFTRKVFIRKEWRQMLAEIAGTAQNLWKKGWAERSAGNFSINITGFLNNAELERLVQFPHQSLPGDYPDLANRMFLVSGTASRMRDMAQNPSEFICFVYVSGSGSAFYCVGENQDGKSVKPTSELATHLAIHQLLVQNNSIEKVVLHAHVTELIALTQIPLFKSAEAINSLLWGMHPETVMFVPDGVGFIPYNLPGTEEIAQATLLELGKHRVIIWEKHGCLAVAKDLPEAFDTFDILAKSALIYFLCKGAGLDPEGLTRSQIAVLRSHHSG